MNPDSARYANTQESPVQRASSPVGSLLKLLLFVGIPVFAASFLFDETKLAAQFSFQSLRESIESQWGQVDTVANVADKSNQAALEQQRIAALRSQAETPQTVAPTQPPTSAMTKFLEALPLPIETVFQASLNLSPSGSQAQLSPDGAVVLTSKYSVMRFGAGNPDDRQLLLSRALYDDAFAGDKFQAFRTALALPDKAYLFGGWHGEVLLHASGMWKRLSSRDQAPTGSIAAMAYWQSDAWVAGAGLWRLNRSQNALEPVEAFSPLRRIEALLPTENGLLVSDRHRVWRYTHGVAKIWSSDLPAGISINGLARALGGDVRVLSKNGIYRAGVDGHFVIEHLPDVWVQQVQEIHGQLWVASWKQGLLLFENGQWYRYGKGQGLASNALSDLVIDKQDHLWVVTYGEGGWQAPRAAAAERLRQFPWEPIGDTD